jgi:hypothetical protein
VIRLIDGPLSEVARRMLAQVLIAEADAFVAQWKDLKLPDGRGRYPPCREESLDDAARAIRHTAQTLYRNDFTLSRIENAMSQVDLQKVEPLLNEIANLLSSARLKIPK